jgi:AraC-like DNA-binding protein
LLDFLTKEVSITDINKLLIPAQKEPRKVIRTVYKLNMSDEVLHTLKISLTENPPPSLIEVAKRLGYGKGDTLYNYSSDLCRAINDRYVKYTNTKRLDNQKLILETVLANQDYPPPSMQEVARNADIHYVTFKRNFPELCAAISARYSSYRHEESKKRLEKIAHEIREIALKLNAEGLEPTTKLIESHFKTRAVRREKKVIEIIRQIRQELGWEN